MCGGDQICIKQIIVQRAGRGEGGDYVELWRGKKLFGSIAVVIFVVTIVIVMLLLLLLLLNFWMYYTLVI